MMSESPQESLQATLFQKMMLRVSFCPSCLSVFLPHTLHSIPGLLLPLFRAFLSSGFPWLSPGSALFIYFHTSFKGSMMPNIAREASRTLRERLHFLMPPEDQRLLQGCHLSFPEARARSRGRRGRRRGERGRGRLSSGEYWRAIQETWLKLYLSNMVLVAAINGASPAGGCLMALSSDYRVLADNPRYRIGLNETLLGIVAPFWFKDVLVNTIGHRAAEHALQLGLLFQPTEALQVGMVDQVVPEDQVQSTALSVMTEWLAIPDHARQLTKSMMRKATADNLIKQREADIQNFVSFVSRDSIQKSLQVYLEKLKQKKH